MNAPSREALDAPAPQLAVTVEAAARALQVGRSAIYALIASGELASFRVGRSRRVPVAALESYIDRQVGSTDG